MQDKTGKKYLEFHQKLLSGRGQADKARALAVAKEIGLDVARIEKGHGRRRGEAPRLEESFKLAEALGLNGTPSYVVGTDVVIGACRRSIRSRKRSTPRAAAGDVLTATRLTAWRASRRPTALQRPCMPG